LLDPVYEETVPNINTSDKPIIILDKFRLIDLVFLVIDG